MRSTTDLTFLANSIPKIPIYTSVYASDFFNLTLFDLILSVFIGVFGFSSDFPIAGDDKKNSLADFARFFISKHNYGRDI